MAADDRQTSRRWSLVGQMRARAPQYRLLRQGSFEVCKGGASRFEIKDPYHLAVALPWPLFVLFSVALLLVVNLAFAALYLVQPGAIRNLAHGDLFHAFFFSLETLSTVGYGEMSPATHFGYLVAGCEMIVGMAFVALLTGLLFARFSQSKPGLLFAERAVVAAHNGVPTLMIRVANARSDMLTEATAKLSVLLREVSSEGNIFRRYYELPLICTRLPAFPLTWTLMHMIDESSPLHGYDAAKLKTDWGRLFLSVEARDVKLGRLVQDLSDYGDERILFDAVYVEAVSYNERGVPTGDLSKLGEVRPAGGRAQP